MNNHCTKVCLCKNVSIKDIQEVCHQYKNFSIKNVQQKTLAGTGCGTCIDTIAYIIEQIKQNKSEADIQQSLPLRVKLLE